MQNSFQNSGMNRILLITPLYPIPYPYNNATDVCHSFAKEWVKQGCEVRVIHLQPVHCAAWHLLVRFFGKQIANLVGGGNFYAHKLKDTEHYVMDEVKIHRIPVYNFLPHGRFPLRSLKKFENEVVRILNHEGFRPDVITGHMMPMEIIPMINAHFNARICNVEHGIPKKIKKRYPDYQRILAEYGLYGFRSKTILERFQQEICPVPNPFVCFSGIPEEYIVEKCPSKYGNAFLYVGELIARKHPAALIPAFAQAFPEKDFTLIFIGEGPEKGKIIKQVSDYGLENCVSFTGKIPRKDILKYYDRSLSMIMISSGEAFGLVYIEAMARGCIPVASRGEGMDGVIVDSENGFLCGAANSEELSGILKKIVALTSTEKGKIMKNAICTAASMTDAVVANQYAKKLLG